MPYKTLPANFDFESSRHLHSNWDFEARVEWGEVGGVGGGKSFIRP